MSDPLSKILEDEESMYGATPARSHLLRMYQASAPEAFLEVLEELVERVVLLEMYLEEERAMTISSGELAEFRARKLPDIRRESGLLASLMFGKVARREGG